LVANAPEPEKPNADPIGLLLNDQQLLAITIGRTVDLFRPARPAEPPPGCVHIAPRQAAGQRKAAQANQSSEKHPPVSGAHPFRNGIECVIVHDPRLLELDRTASRCRFLCGETAQSIAALPGTRIAVHRAIPETPTRREHARRAAFDSARIPPALALSCGHSDNLDEPRYSLASLKDGSWTIDGSIHSCARWRPAEAGVRF
jgi:hypothetical protein